MKLTFLGTETEDNKSPTLYATDHGTFVVQGWKITDPEARAGLRGVSDHEDAVEIPPALLRFLPAEQH